MNRLRGGPSSFCTNFYPTISTSSPDRTLLRAVLTIWDLKETLRWRKFVHPVVGELPRSPMLQPERQLESFQRRDFMTYTRAAQDSKSEEKQIHTRISTSPAGPADSQAGTRAVAISMYCVLLASYAVNAADRQLFPLLAHDVRQQYGFSLADTGLLTTIFTLGLAMAGLPTGYLLARFPRKTVLLLGIGIFSTGTALTVL